MSVFKGNFVHLLTLSIVV